MFWYVKKTIFLIVWESLYQNLFFLFLGIGASIDKCAFSHRNFFKFLKPQFNLPSCVICFYIHDPCDESSLFSKGCTWNAPKGSRPNLTWSSINKSRWILEEGWLWRVRNGRTIKISQDKWVPRLPRNKNWLHELHVIIDEMRVCKFFEVGEQKWDDAKLSEFFYEATVRNIVSSPLIISVEEDCCYRKHNSDGVYSVKLGYQVANNKYNSPES